MAAKKIDWLGIIAAFIREHPKTSAAVAFNLGVAAAYAAKRRNILGGGGIRIPDKLIELVPSVNDLSSYVPLIGAAKPKTRRKAERRTAGKAAGKSTGKSAGKSAPRTPRKAAGGS
jgi:hypothetical protein